MICAWTQFLAVIPESIRRQVDGQGRGFLRELRLRVGEKPELCFAEKSIWLEHQTTLNDIAFCMNIASRYSPWSATSTAQGYLTAPGGHRIGICGETVLQSGNVTGFRTVRSLCIRVARDFPGFAAGLENISGNLLILGRPGSGKTTLLRDYARRCGEKLHICAVDERGELFPETMEGPCFYSGPRVDVFSLCTKAWGIAAAVKVMAPDRIVVDEITSREDCEALLQASRCGVPFTATAHASSVEDLRLRPVYRPLYESRLFDYAIQMKSDATWKGAQIDYDG